MPEDLSTPTLPTRPPSPTTGTPTGGPTSIRPTAFIPVGQRYRRRWPVALFVAVCVAAGAFLIFGTGDSGTERTPIDALAGAGRTDDAPGVGDTVRSGTFDITLLQVVDPWVPTNEIERAVEGRRLVAAEILVRNVGTTTETVLTQTMARLTYDGDRPANFGVSLLELLPVDGPVEPGATRQGWIVFELDAAGSGLVLELRMNPLSSTVAFEL